MQKFVRSSIVVLASVAALFGGRSFAQDLPDSPRSEWAARSFAFFEHSFADPNGPLSRELGNSMVYAMKRSEGFPENEWPISTCARLLGAGGSSKLDGGGNLVAASPTFFERGMVVEPTDIVAGLTPSPAIGTIVIVDHFDLGSLKDSLSAMSSHDRGALWNAFYAADSNVPHGHLVAYHALAHLDWTELELPSNQSGNDRLEFTLKFGTADVVQVRLAHIQYDDMSSIETAMAESNQGGAIVVTSWSLVDCALATQYSELSAAGTAPETFVDYMRAALDAAGDSANLMHDLCTAFLHSSPSVSDDIDCSDPEDLLDLGTIAAIAAMSVQASEDVGMREEDGSWDRSWDPVMSATVFAAAGNQGLPFPMPPAAWPPVIGVEACTRAVPGRSRFSNAGSLGPGYGDRAVRALGAWFATNEWLEDTDDENARTRLGYWGTSFAAPAAAMNFAATPGIFSQSSLARLEECLL
jgi:hypothetical protein